MVRCGIITGYGINADYELVEAFELCQAEAQRIHIQDLIEEPTLLQSFHILGFAGGFSFGDHLGSGFVFAHLFKNNLKTELDLFIQENKLIIGICNGFQVLVKMGILPNLENNWEQDVSLVHNAQGVFEDSWVTLACNPGSPCVWTRGLKKLYLPIRHGEGRFITKDPRTRQQLQNQDLIALQYAGRNPNGSEDNIAGITDRTGRVLGLMPHPEAFLYRENHPHWSRQNVDKIDGIALLQNGVTYIKTNFNNTKD